jgi:serine/threonine-protein kinase HipA
VRKLLVWLADLHIATLTEDRYGLSLVYTNAAKPLGTPLISVSMPVVSRRYGTKVVRPFFNGLLPEGEARMIITYDLGIDSLDDFGLLVALGRDCAGALTIQLPNDPVPAQRSGVGSGDLRVADIERLLAELPIHPLGFDGNTIRVSLAGVQPKLLLTQTDDHRWSLPTGSVISTHILKPGSRLLPSTVANEAFCMTAANLAGVSAAATSVERFGGSPVLISARYDRRYSEDGSVERIHQEDACQALSILTVPPIHKYQRYSPSLSFSAVQRVLSRWADGDATNDLLSHLAFNIIIGNADYHGKNVSLLHDPDGVIHLAPLYDAMCTCYYSGRDGVPAVDTELGLYVGGARDINEVTMRHVIEESSRWGMRPTRSLAVLSELVEKLPEALSQAASRVADLPESVYETVLRRLVAARQQLAG